MTWKTFWLIMFFGLVALFAINPSAGVVLVQKVTGAFGALFANVVIGLFQGFGWSAGSIDHQSAYQLGQLLGLVAIGYAIYLAVRDRIKGGGKKSGGGGAHPH